MTDFNLTSWSAGQTIFALPYIPIVGSQQITVNALKSLTVPGGARFALVQVEGGSGVRYWDDGTVPTATVGQWMYPGSSPLLYGGNLNAIQFFPVSGTALLNVSYYK